MVVHGPRSIQGEPARGPLAPHRTVAARAPNGAPGHNADHAQDGLYRGRAKIGCYSIVTDANLVVYPILWMLCNRVSA